MEKKIGLFLCLFFLSFNLTAQQFVKSFKKDYLEQLYVNCPDSLKADLFSIEPQCVTYKLSDSLSLKNVTSLILSDDLLLRYSAEDFCADIESGDDDFCFNLYYRDPTDTICVFRVMSGTGVCYQKIVTKSAKEYVLECIWGFVTLKENGFVLLDCYCGVDETEDEVNLHIVPFEGTNPFVWQKNVNGSLVPAF